MRQGDGDGRNPRNGLKGDLVIPRSLPTSLSTRHDQCYIQGLIGTFPSKWKNGISIAIIYSDFYSWSKLALRVSFDFHAWCSRTVCVGLRFRIVK